MAGKLQEGKSVAESLIPGVTDLSEFRYNFYLDSLSGSIPIQMSYGREDCDRFILIIAL